MFSPSVNKEKMRTKKWAMKIVCFFAFCAFATPAFSQSDLYNRLKRAERDIETLSKSVYKGQKLPEGFGQGADDDQKYRAQMDVRLSDLETQIRGLRGQVEQYQYNIDTLTSKVQALELRSRQDVSGNNNNSNSVVTINDNSMVASDSQPLMTEPNTEPNVVKPSAEIVSEQASQNVLQASSPTDAYEAAYSLLKNGNNQGAQVAFDAFIREYKEDPLAHNARYWLGETYYVQGEYEPAARIFAEAYQKAPEGVKAADNLLKLGLSLSGLGRTEDACVSLAQLDKAFGNTSSTIVHRGKQERTKLGCE